MNRFKAIQKVHPEVVSLIGDNDARDINNKKIPINETLVKVEVTKLDKIQAEAQAKTDLKKNGEDYQGYQIPFMNEDAIALMQVKSAFEMGVTSTNIEFSNGTIMPMTPTAFQEFAVWFVNKRNSFFV